METLPSWQTLLPNPVTSHTAAGDSSPGMIGDDHNSRSASMSQLSASMNSKNCTSPTACTKSSLKMSAKRRLHSSQDWDAMQRQNGRPSQTETVLTDDQEEAILTSHGVALRQLSCTACGKAVLPTRGGWIRWLKEFMCSKKSLSCSHCGFYSKHGEKSLLVIWACLCSLEDYELDSRGSQKDAPKAQSPESPTPSAKPPTVHGPAVKAPTMKTNGTGYGGPEFSHYHEALQQAQSTVPPLPTMTVSRRRLRKAVDPRPTELTTEELSLADMFKALTVLIPSVSSPVDTQLLRVMVRRSLLLETVATYLRTSDFDTVARLHDLYSSVLSFLQCLSGNPSLSGLLRTRELFASEVRILDLSFPGHSKDGKLAKETVQTVQPLSVLLQPFSAAAEHMQTFNLGDLEDSDHQHLLHIFQQLCSLNHSLNEKCMSSGISEPKGKLKEEETASPQEQHTQWHRSRCVEAVDDELLQSSHYYCNNPPKNQQGQIPAKGRARRLLTELTALSSSLPEGIFIRHGNSRLDIMKVLIAGPAGTPYARGLFEFDLLCPMDYPQRPPMMHFRTTGKGRAHFNPNLYQSGKVCLSLLGTWSGPGWVPHESTILQILVSLQAMVLCEKPWYNEPGRENYESEEASQNYNRHIQTLTVTYALNDWFRPLSPKSLLTADPIWAEAVQKHFEMYGEEICQTNQVWVEEAANAKAALLAKKPPASTTPSWTNAAQASQMNFGQPPTATSNGVLEQAKAQMPPTSHPFPSVMKKDIPGSLLDEQALMHIQLHQKKKQLEVQKALDTNKALHAQYGQEGQNPWQSTTKFHGLNFVPGDFASSKPLSEVIAKPAIVGPAAKEPPFTHFAPEWTSTYPPESDEWPHKTYPLAKDFPMPSPGENSAAQSVNYKALNAVKLGQAQHKLPHYMFPPHSVGFDSTAGTIASSIVHPVTVQSSALHPSMPQFSVSHPSVAQSLGSKPPDPLPSVMHASTQPSKISASIDLSAASESNHEQVHNTDSDDADSAIGNLNKGLDVAHAELMSQSIPAELTEADKGPELHIWLTDTMNHIELLKSKFSHGSTMWTELLEKQYDLAEEASLSNKAGTVYDPASLFVEPEMDHDDDEMVTDYSPFGDEGFYYPGAGQGIEKSVEEFARLWKEFRDDA